MYFKGDKKEFLNGHKIAPIARELIITAPYLTSILNGYRSCSPRLARELTVRLKNSKDFSKYFTDKKEN